VSTGSAPLLIGDFERIFPFDAVTAQASDSIATASVLRAKATAPLPVLFSAFAKQTISSLKHRIRARDPVVAERANDSSLTLRHAFAPTSLLPPPWTPESIAVAVARAKDAAKLERARLGLPESSAANVRDSEPHELTDVSLQVEHAIRSSESANSQVDDHEATVYASAISSE
jgi:hypothetical protein